MPLNLSGDETLDLWAMTRRAQPFKGEFNVLFDRHGFRHVVNLAAQAGVRHSIENPHAYAEANLIGFLNILEELYLLRAFAQAYVYDHLQNPRHFLDVFIAHPLHHGRPNFVFELFIQPWGCFLFH